MYLIIIFLFITTLKGYLAIYTSSGFIASAIWAFLFFIIGLIVGILVALESFKYHFITKVPSDTVVRNSRKQYEMKLLQISNELKSSHKMETVRMRIS